MGSCQNTTQPLHSHTGEFQGKLVLQQDTWVMASLIHHAYVNPQVTTELSFVKEKKKIKYSYVLRSLSRVRAEGMGHVEDDVRERLMSDKKWLGQ